ncbi:hypothetical protein PROFUN_03913 [Planoprotostelium fungivorum]|uniref:Helicase ATP-binding domain-containing protein n=1 Tax=Planoprotostelium fungivorum TaxID=1890364 RepID=A0A2P6MTR2_9EUKA|nr:hypothetical protein PROFUN_03913 [Planoprotostelium fungivorum]
MSRSHVDDFFDLTEDASKPSTEFKRLTPVTTTQCIKSIYGIEVSFPFTPYTSQCAVMSRVLEAMSNSKNALLESPTGTGKTLSLLCSTLAWQSIEKKQVQTLRAERAASSKNKKSEKEREQKEGETGITAAVQKSPKGLLTAKSYSGNKVINLDEKKVKIPSSKISPTGSRSRIIIQLEDDDDDFQPMKKRVVETEAEHEEEKKVDEERPREQEEKEKEEMRHPLIFYCSRTHSQIAQVVRELKKTIYKPRMSVLGSRDHYCIHPRVSKSGKSKSSECRKISKPLREGCLWKNNVKNIANSDVFDLGQRLNVWDIEDLVQFGRDVNGCPYYASQALVAKSDIVFAPYNYLLDISIRESMQMHNLMHNSIIILDEAQCVTFTSAIVRMHSQNSFSAALKIIDEFLEYTRCFLNDLKPSNFEEYSSVRPCAEMVQRMTKAGMTHMNCKSIRMDIRHWLGLNSDDEQSITESFSMDTLLENLFYIFEYISVDDYKYAPDYRVAVQKVPRYVEGRKEWIIKIGLWCMNPSVAIRPLAESCKSIILTSGTLSPMQSFANELSIDFPITLEASHSVNMDKQVWIGAFKQHKGRALNSSFKNSDAFQYQDAVGESIIEASRVIPHGVLCFFPSYGLMNKLIQRWKSTEAWGRLTSVKHIMTEPQNPQEGEFNGLMREYDRKIRESRETTSSKKKGVIMLAVCRGKRSTKEGVIMVGIPFPLVRDPKVMQKKEYNDQMHKKGKRQNGNDWYTQQAFRAVNQALGRCLRHHKDYGAILLLDERYQEKENIAKMSRWLRANDDERMKAFQAVSLLSFPTMIYLTHNNVNKRAQEESSSSEGALLNDICAFGGKLHCLISSHPEYQKLLKSSLVIEWEEDGISIVEPNYQSRSQYTPLPTILHALEEDHHIKLKKTTLERYISHLAPSRLNRSQWGVRLKDRGTLFTEITNSLMIRMFQLVMKEMKTNETSKGELMVAFNKKLYPKKLTHESLMILLSRCGIQVKGDRVRVEDTTTPLKTSFDECIPLMLADLMQQYHSQIRKVFLDRDLDKKLSTRERVEQKEESEQVGQLRAEILRLRGELKERDDIIEGQRRQIAQLHRIIHSDTYTTESGQETSVEEILLRGSITRELISEDELHRFTGYRFASRESEERLRGSSDAEMFSTLSWFIQLYSWMSQMNISANQEGEIYLASTISSTKMTNTMRIIYPDVITSETRPFFLSLGMTEARCSDVYRRVLWIHDENREETCKKISLDEMKEQLRFLEEYCNKEQLRVVRETLWLPLREDIGSCDRTYHLYLHSQSLVQLFLPLSSDSVDLVCAINQVYLPSIRSMTVIIGIGSCASEELDALLRYFRGQDISSEPLFSIFEEHFDTYNISQQAFIMDKLSALSLPTHFGARHPPHIFDCPELESLSSYLPILMRKSQDFLRREDFVRRLGIHRDPNRRTFDAAHEILSSINPPEEVWNRLREIYTRYKVPFYPSVATDTVGAKGTTNADEIEKFTVETKEEHNKAWISYTAESYVYQALLRYAEEQVRYFQNRSSECDNSAGYDISVDEGKDVDATDGDGGTKSVKGHLRPSNTFKMTSNEIATARRCFEEGQIYFIVGVCVSPTPHVSYCLQDTLLFSPTVHLIPKQYHKVILCVVFNLPLKDGRLSDLEGGSKFIKSYDTMCSRAVSQHSISIAHGSLPYEFGMGSWAFSQAVIHHALSSLNQLQTISEVDIAVIIKNQMMMTLLAPLVLRTVKGLEKQGIDPCTPRMLSDDCGSSVGYKHVLVPSASVEQPLDRRLACSYQLNITSITSKYTKSESAKL